jgi:hypothetical protein
MKTIYKVKQYKVSQTKQRRFIQELYNNDF